MNPRTAAAPKPINRHQPQRNLQQSAALLQSPTDGCACALQARPCRPHVRRHATRAGVHATIVRQGLEKGCPRHGGGSGKEWISGNGIFQLFLGGGGAEVRAWQLGEA